ncbi:hypothetical protein Pcinc_039921 [Petrolisthes cinctipes]|uniref:Uncharacterized protein n=1 Tax=Petrolisthes cinctipes TaxID=88211 RepID=A0AAE1BN70_PETCI|nr:hypothetical protein Pcinc_039921 [Petrolisthes cinctipes]
MGSSKFCLLPKHQPSHPPSTREQRRTMYLRSLVWKDVRATSSWDRSGAGVAVRMVVAAHRSEKDSANSFTPNE